MRSQNITVALIVFFHYIKTHICNVNVTFRPDQVKLCRFELKLNHGSTEGGNGTLEGFFLCVFIELVQQAVVHIHRGDFAGSYVCQRQGLAARAATNVENARVWRRVFKQTEGYLSVFFIARALPVKSFVAFYKIFGHGRKGFLYFFEGNDKFFKSISDNPVKLTVVFFKELFCLQLPVQHV